MRTIGLLSVILFGIAAPTGTVAAPSTPVAIPAYDAVPHADHYATQGDYKLAVDDRRFTLTRVSYDSDGLRVFAYVYGPTHPRTKLPVIVFNRGSYTWDGFAGELVTMAHRLAENGYLVVAPMYRGSGGAPGRDEMGGADVDDLMNLQSVLPTIAGADASRVYLYGESRGGMMVYQALRDGFPARAAAVVGGFTDLDGMLQNPKWAQIGEQIWPELATHRDEVVRRRSALLWPEKIAAPTLIIHGADDTQVPPVQSLKMAERLTELGKPYQLLIVANEGHTISGRPADRDRWVLDWFRRH